MKVDEYNRFVQNTDQSKNLDVALYGIAGELGSVVSAIKRRLIADDPHWNTPNNEITEELGDLLWYCFAFSQCLKNQRPKNFLAHDIANLRKEIDGNNKRAERIGIVLDPTKRGTFLAAAANFPSRARNMTLDDYQKVAFLTARTEGRTLIEVCLAVLSQLSGELFRLKLPEIERMLNKTLPDRPIMDVLGEMAWHIAAVASVYGVPLNRIAKENMRKVSLRYVRGEPTPLYDNDENLLEQEKLPRRLEVCFVSAPGKVLQMYSNGKQLGDPLTDNAQDEDGYRFHDVLHLAFAAKLGWSPVLRKILGRKRKSQPIVDEVEDGARAQIMEEAVINAIHAEGVRQAEARPQPESSDHTRLFATRSEISFDLLKLIQNFVRDNEVAKSQYWEWEDAIYEGFDIFHKLREEGQGTVTLDLEKRSIGFRPTVYVGLRGQVAALGSAVADVTPSEAIQRKTLIQLAILNALGIDDPSKENCALIDINETSEAGVVIKARGRVLQAMWDQGIVEFRITISENSSGSSSCTVIGVCDTS